MTDEVKVKIGVDNFTKDQAAAYKNLIEFINAPYNPNDYKRALVGAAGTGKTYLVKALIQNCRLSNSLIGLAAPTHKACRVLHDAIGLPNIKVNTLQSDLGLRLNFDIDKFDIANPPFDPKGKIKIEKYQIYIVDEASMINRGLAMFLENTCKEHSCKILMIGDDSQLNPVGERYSSAFRGIKLFKLTEIVRQGEDNPISKLLELLRFDIKFKTTKFLETIAKYRNQFNADNTKGFLVCDKKTFEEEVYRHFQDDELKENVDFAKVIAYTNNAVSGWNKFIRNAIIKDADKAVLTKNDLLISYTTLVDTFNQCIIKNSEDYILKDITNYAHPRYNIKGFMVRLIAIHGGDSTKPLFIVDHKDKESVFNYVRISRKLINDAKTAPTRLKAEKWKAYYDFKDKCLLLTNIINAGTGNVEFARNLDYGFSLTAHKAQGSTFDTVLVDVNDIVFDRYGRQYTNLDELNRRLYVACSRCRNKLYMLYG